MIARRVESRAGPKEKQERATGVNAMGVWKDECVCACKSCPAWAVDQTDVQYMCTCVACGRMRKTKFEVRWEGVGWQDIHGMVYDYGGMWYASTDGSKCGGGVRRGGS
jgi:hypothetical protein